MKFFEFFFFPVSGSNAYKDALGFHKNYFVDNSGFLYGFILAAIIGIVFAAIFYFIFCNNYSIAKKLNWWIISLVVAVGSYFASDLCLIGGQGSTSVSTFYGCNEQYVRENRNKPNTKQYARLNMKIKGELQKQKDVRVPFDLTCAGWSWLIFFGFSIWWKRYSKHGTQIPF